MTEANVTHVQPQHRNLQKAGSCGVVIPGIESKVIIYIQGVRKKKRNAVSIDQNQRSILYNICFPL